MKIFTFFTQRFALFILLSVSGLSMVMASEPQVPTYLDPSSRKVLGEIREEFKGLPVTPEERDNLYWNFVILAQGDDRVPLFPYPHADTPMEGIKVMNHAAYLAVIRLIGREVARLQKCECDLAFQFWRRFEELVERCNQTVTFAQSYGDPHINTYDGAIYSLQRAGEFVMTRGGVGKFEIQVRQSPQNRFIAVNSAVAMNVWGDQVAFYGKKSGFPDNDKSTGLRINGTPHPMKKGKIKLPNGGQVEIESKRKLLVSWPTGEKVAISSQGMGEFTFLNIVPLVYFGEEGNYVGLLGNADGNSANDLADREGGNYTLAAEFYTMEEMLRKKGAKSGVVKLERDYQEHLAMRFGDSWRVDSAESLFDYAGGKSTESFTDLFFPEKYQVLADLPPDALADAKRTCEQAGVGETELRGCMSDVLFTGDTTFVQSTAEISKRPQLLKELKVVDSVWQAICAPISYAERNLILLAIRREVKEARREEADQAEWQKVLKTVAQGPKENSPPTEAARKTAPAKPVLTVPETNPKEVEGKGRKVPVLGKG